MHICLDYIPELLAQPDINKQVYTIVLLTIIINYWRSSPDVKPNTSILLVDIRPEFWNNCHIFLLRKLDISLPSFFLSFICKIVQEKGRRISTAKCYCVLGCLLRCFLHVIHVMYIHDIQVFAVRLTASLSRQYGVHKTFTMAKLCINTLITLIGGKLVH